MKDLNEQRGYGVCTKCGTMVPPGEACEECPKRRTPAEIERDEAMARSGSDRETASNLRKQIDGYQAEITEALKAKAMGDRIIEGMRGVEIDLQSEVTMLREVNAAQGEEIALLKSTASPPDRPADGPDNDD